MRFHFNKTGGDALSTKIRLKDLNKTARQWDHPVKGLLKFHTAFIAAGKDIYKVPKKERELYCICLAALALMTDQGGEWWVNVPALDTPDGLVTTFKPDGSGQRGFMREIEVVEFRGEAEELVNVIKRKLIEKAYSSGTVLVCLALTQGVYDLQQLSEVLQEVPSNLNHVFITFSGVALSDISKLAEAPKDTYSMVQILPVFAQLNMRLEPFLQDFNEKYEKGQESRLIEGTSIFYGTCNPKYSK